jgi:hypothetical protein
MSFRMTVSFQRVAGHRGRLLLQRRTSRLEIDTAAKIFRAFWSEGRRRAVGPRECADPMRQRLTASYDFYFGVVMPRLPLPRAGAHLHAARGGAAGASSISLWAPRRQKRRPPRRLPRPVPGDAAADLAGWHAVEQENPTVFSGMYSLWFHRAAGQAAVDPRWLAGATM